MSRVAAILIMFLVGVSTCVISQNRIDAARELRADEELYYLPNEKLMTHFTGGMSSVLADILWLQTIQYTSEEFHNPERKFLWLEHLCRTVTRLDPHYEGVYAVGGMFMASIGSDERAMEFLKEGMINCPDSESIPFEMAKVWLLNRYEEPNASEIATHYLRMVAERSDDPEYYLRWIRGIHEQGDLSASARMMWQDIAENSGDEMIVEIARTNLKKMTITESIDSLTDAMDRFEALYDTSAKSFSELVSVGVLDALPQSMDSDRLFIDLDGQVKSTWLLSREEQRITQLLQAGIESYFEEEGRYPGSLAAWAEWSEVDVPDHPYASQQWSYNPLTGTIE